MPTLEDSGGKTAAAPVTKGAAFVQRVEQAGQFLRKYGIRTDELSDVEILSKAENILALSNSAAQVLSRGQVVDALENLLKRYVPKGFVGEFKRERDLDVQRAEALGWSVFIAEGKVRESLTNSADGKVRLGDLILMIQPEDNYVAYHIARERRKAKRREGRDPKKAGAQQGDEFGFGAHPDVPIVNV